MEIKKKIMIDMDDVIVNGGFLYLINKFLGTEYTESDFTEFYMQDVIPNKDEFFKFFLENNLYDHCELLPSAYDVLKELNEKYDIFIGTSYIYPEIPDESGKILLQKYNYLRKTLPFISPYKYIFLSDKSVLDFDIKIDDRLDNLKNAKQKLLFTAYHNFKTSDDELNSEGAKRVRDWNHIKEILL